MITKNGRDLPILEITKANYLVPTGEERVYHVKIEQRKHRESDGVRVSIPRIQKFGVKEWATVQTSLKRQGYTIEVLHDPTEYQSEIEAQKAKQAQESKKAKEAIQKKAAKIAEQSIKNAQAVAEKKAKEEAAKAEQEKAKQREALKAELRAEIEAEMKAADAKKK